MPKTSGKAKAHGHYGNNGLKGKPSNNKGKKRQRKEGQTKSIRRSKLDVELKKLMEDGTLQDSGSDVEENLPYEPVSAHMYRSAFIRLWCSKLLTHEVNEESALKNMLGHETETNCIFDSGEPPSCATAEHLRTKINVRGKPYTLPPVKREADRHIRPYHFWMYNSGKFSREELAKMGKGQEDQYNASHICGGSCLNHAFPESNRTNQSRKPHHEAMVEALSTGNIEAYRILRHKCEHEPRCFVNPTTRKLDQIVKQKGHDYMEALFKCL